MEDEELEDVTVVDGIVYVKEEYRRKLDLAYSVTCIDNMEITQVNVHEQPTLPVVMQQLRASTSEVISHKHTEDRVEHVEDQEETDEVMVVGEFDFWVSRWCMMLRDTNIRLMKMVISSLILILNMMPLPRNKMIKNRKTERNQHRSCLWVCGGILSIKC